MSTEHTFDVVSKVDLQEVRNALQMAGKEIGTRFDFRGTGARASFEEKPPVLLLAADHELQLRSVRDVVTQKLAARKVPLKAIVFEASEHIPGGSVKQKGVIQQGLTQDQARAIVKVVKDQGLKVQPRIEGDAVRVSAKQIDDLQTVMHALREQEFGTAIQFENYR